MKGPVDFWRNCTEQVMSFFSATIECCPHLTKQPRAETVGSRPELVDQTVAVSQIATKEMCHAAVGRGGHGPRFLAELRKLKLAGAPVEDYDVTGGIRSNEILGIAGDAGLETGWDWKTVLIASIMCTGMRMVRAWSAMARVTP